MIKPPIYQLRNLIKNWQYLVFLCLLSIGNVKIAQAQFSKTMHFDGSIADVEGGEEPTFIVQEIATNTDQITYTSGTEDQAIALDSASGLMLPSVVTDSLIGSKVWTFQMRFKITDFGAGNGNRVLVSLKKPGTGTAPYFYLQTIKSNDSTGRVQLKMNDRSNGVNLSTFYFELGSWVNLTFTIDFDQLSYTLSGDSYFISKTLDDFDYTTFITYGNALQDQQFCVGSYESLMDKQGSTNPAYSAAHSANLVIDELIVSNTAPETDASVYESALQQLTNHLNEIDTLSDEEISTYTSEVLNNYSGNYIASKTIVNNYLEAYEAKYDPLFLTFTKVDVFADYDEFGWITFTLQQDIHDNYFTNEYIDEVAGLSFEAAEGFPGPVADTAERLNNETVLINATYKADPGYNLKTLQDDYGAFARRPTGLYAAPGELIAVTVPDELVGIGAEIVIGSFTHDISGKLGTGLRRFPRVIKEYEIFQSTMEVANPFGGIIYLYIPEGTDLGMISIEISGGVKFPYFAMTSEKSSDLTEFQALVASGDVLWAEVETDNFMFTGPLAYFQRDDILETLEMWDDLWEAYQLYNGRPTPRHKAEHYIIDRMSKWNTLAGGYPMVMGSNNTPNTDIFWAFLGTNMMNILDYERVIHDDKATYWHEMSHHNSLPTLPNEAECIVEVAYVAVHNIAWGMPLDSAMKYSERGFYTRDEAIIDWVVEPNFRNNEEMTGVQRQYQQRGYSKYVDIAALFGWDSLGLINKVFYDDWTAMGGQVNDPDGFRITDTEWIMASCNALNMNIAPLYHFWGEQPHDSIFDLVNTYPRSKEIYNRLREIRDFIPKTAEEFQPYYDARSNKETYQVALADWETNFLYDSIIAEIDSIIFWYYGGDFDQDGYLFYEDCDDTDPGVFTATTWYLDFDGDGFGDSTQYVSTCYQPANYVLDNTDCNDTLMTANSDGIEVINGVDDNCNGEIDEGIITSLTGKHVENLVVFPNPSQGLIHWKMKLNFKLLDSTGQLRVEDQGDRFDMTKLENGIYFLIVENYAPVKVIKK